MTSKTQRNLLRLLGPVLLIGVLYKLPDRGALWRQFEAALGWELLVALLLNLAITYVKVVRWRRLLLTRAIDYPFSKAWTAFTAVLYVGLLTPGRVGDILRVKYLRQDTGASYSDGLASIVVDRICDLYVLLGFVALGVASLSVALAPELAQITWLGVALAAGGPLLVLVPGVADKFMQAVYRRVAKQDSAGMGNFLVSLRSQAVRGAALAVPLTALGFGINYLQGWLIVRAMGLPLSFMDVLAVLSLASLFSLVPVSVSGIGVREMLFSVLFPYLGSTPEGGVGFGLLVFAIMYLPLLVYGFFSWQYSPLPLGDDKSSTEPKGPRNEV